jgi:hypothetical protein
MTQGSDVCETGRRRLSSVRLIKVTQLGKSYCSNRRQHLSRFTPESRFLNRPLAGQGRYPLDGKRAVEVEGHDTTIHDASEGQVLSWKF